MPFDGLQKNSGVPQKPGVLASGRHVFLTLEIATSTALYWQAEPQMRICVAHLAEQPPTDTHTSQTMGKCSNSHRQIHNSC